MWKALTRQFLFFRTFQATALAAGQSWLAANLTLGSNVRRQTRLRHSNVPLALEQLKWLPQKAFARDDLNAFLALLRFFVLPGGARCVFRGDGIAFSLWSASKEN